MTRRGRLFPRPRPFPIRKTMAAIARGLCGWFDDAGPLGGHFFGFEFLRELDVMKESVESEALVMPSSSGRPIDGRPPLARGFFATNPFYGRIQPTKPPRAAISSRIWSCACCFSVLAVPCIRLVFGVAQLRRLPRAATKEGQWNIQGGCFAAVDHCDEPLLAGTPGLGDNLARFTAGEDDGLVPNGGDGGKHIARRIFKIALRVTAKAEER